MEAAYFDEHVRTAKQQQLESKALQLNNKLKKEAKEGRRIQSNQVFDRDIRGRVRGLGTVSKTAIKHSAPYKRALEEEHECNTHLQTEVKRLKEAQMGIRREMDKLKQAVK